MLRIVADREESRYGAISKTPRIDFRFSNGTHRDHGQVELRVIPLGEEGKIRAVRMPVGAILAEPTKTLVARIAGVTFRVRDITLELIYALP